MSQTPGWERPGEEPADADGGQPPYPGWSTRQPPAAVKPGVIPLRPLGVGEILDGAVTTIRRNPGPMLGLSAIVAIVTQLLGLGIGWWLFDQTDEVALSPTADPDEVLDALA